MNKNKKQIMLIGGVFGFIASLTSILSDNAAVAVSWAIPVVALILGMFAVKHYGAKTIGEKFVAVVKMSVVFVLSFAATSTIVTIADLSLNSEWGLSGFNVLSVAGVISLLIGILVGITAQLIVFVVFGMIGGMLVRNDRN
jgi:hypothetical protein